MNFVTQHVAFLNFILSLSNLQNEEIPSTIPQLCLKDLILKAGNYQKCLILKIGIYGYELFFVTHLYNIQESLVKMKTGYEQLERRRGFLMQKMNLTS